MSSILSAARSRNTLLDYLFEAQRAAVVDESSKKCLWCTGRAGKTTGVLTDFFHDGMLPGHEFYRYIYIARTSESAEEIAWPIAKELDRKFDLGCNFQEHKLKVTMPSGSWLRLYGANKPGWMDNLYGQKFRKLAIDEAAFFQVDLEAFIDDILELRGLDLNAQIYLMSIPPRDPTGLFHEIIKGFEKRVDMQGVPSPTKVGWSVHSWTTESNPAMSEKFIKLRDEKLAQNPDIINDPGFRRNYLGERVTDRGKRVYDYKEERNAYKGKWEPRDGDHYILGIDFGWDDHQAFSVICWREDTPTLVEVESYREKEMRMDKIASYVRFYMEAYPGLEIVGDPAHKQYFEEFRRRFDLPVLESEKANKYDWIEVINTDLVSGNIKIADADTSPHVEEMTTLKKRFRKDKTWAEQPGADNDCCDAFLAAYRHAYHYLYEEPEPEPDPEKEMTRRIAEHFLEEDAMYDDQDDWI